MIRTTLLWEIVAWLSLPILALLVGLFLKRKLYREFPFFFAYLLSAGLTGLVRLAAYQNWPKSYFYVYWYSDFFLTVVTFLALYEVFLRRVFPFFFSVQLYRFLFPIAAAVFCLLAFVAALSSSNRAVALFVTSGSFDLLRSLVAGFFVALALVMGRSFSGREFSIAFGFGLQAAAAMAVSGLRSKANYHPTFLDRFEPLVYDISCLIWLISFWRSGKQDREGPTHETAVVMLREAKGWEAMLKDWLIWGKNKR